MLNVVDSLPVPERAAEYGAQVWQRIEHRLPARRRSFWMLPTAVATGRRPARPSQRLLVAAFIAGRFYPQAQQPAQMAAADAQAGERVLLVAVGDYLERSQMVLIELANANPKGPLDISTEQERAGDLVTETRLYRQTAAHTGDTRITGVLDELERVLVDITHAPSKISPGPVGRTYASGWKPKAYSSRSACWAPTSGTRKYRPRRRPDKHSRRKTNNDRLSNTQIRFARCSPWPLLPSRRHRAPAAAPRLPMPAWLTGRAARGPGARRTHSRRGPCR